MRIINHIHIPRCSGIYLNGHIVNNLKSLSIPFITTNHGLINEITFNNKKFISGHYGITPLEYIENPINTTMVRNPIDRYISNFLYIYKGHDMHKDFESWLYDENIYKNQINLQTRFLTKKLNIDSYNSKNHGLERAEDGWCLDKTELNIKDAIKTINSCEIVGIFEDHHSFLNKYNNLLLSNFGFTTFSNKNKINGNFTKMQLSDTIVKRIEELNYLDMELYDYARSKG